MLFLFLLNVTFFHPLLYTVFDTVGLKRSESYRFFQHLVWLMWPSVTPCDRGQGHLPRERPTARGNYIFLSRARNKQNRDRWHLYDLSTFGSVFLAFPCIFLGSFIFSQITLSSILWLQNPLLNVEDLPRVSQGSFFQEQMSSPVRRMAWSWCRPSLPPRVDCQWQKLFSVWSAWWLITKPSWEISR